MIPKRRVRSSSTAFRRREAVGSEDGSSTRLGEEDGTAGSKRPAPTTVSVLGGRGGAFSPPMRR